MSGSFFIIKKFLSLYSVKLNKISFIKSTTSARQEEENIRLQLTETIRVKEELEMKIKEMQKKVKVSFYLFVCVCFKYSICAIMRNNSLFDKKIRWMEGKLISLK